MPETSAHAVVAGACLVDFRDPSVLPSGPRQSSKRARGGPSISLWKIPSRSPDLNPVEKFWSWLRRELRRRDLQDYRQKKACLTKAQYIARVRQVLGTEKAQQVAKRIASVSRKRARKSTTRAGRRPGLRSAACAERAEFLRAARRPPLPRAPASRLALASGPREEAPPRA